MASVLIIGATGKVGSRLARKLLGNGHEAVGTYRRADQAVALRIEGVLPVECDIVSAGVAEMAALMSGIDAVVFTAGAAGAGRELTDAIDGEGVLKASAAAQVAGVKRFLLISAFPDAWRSKRMSESFEHYMFVKRHRCAPGQH